MRKVAADKVIYDSPSNFEYFDCLTKGAELIAPHLVHWEVGNAFSAMLRRKKITLDEALKALDANGKIPIGFLHVELELSLRIADQLGIYAYDAFILRCSEKYRAPLVSLDRCLVDCAKSVGIRVMEVF